MRFDTIIIGGGLAGSEAAYQIAKRGIKVKLYETDSSYFISVKDNGVGFDVAELDMDTHIGLRNIKSRLEAMCGGILHIESIVGVGTKITVEIPKEAD